MKKAILLLMISTGLWGQNGWQLLPGFTESFNSTYITSSGTIFIGSDLGNIYSSTDGGATWDTASTNAQDGISDITFISASEAWAVGDDGLIMQSIDAGATWISVVSGVSSNLESIHFPTATTAYIAGRNGTILKSSNGGTSWSAQTSGSSDRLESVFFTSATRGFVAGRDGAFLETSNGGTTWTSAPSLGSDDNKEVFFLDADTGFVGGENGIFKTTNGGTIWSATTTVGLNEINALHFGSSTHGYVVGEQGDLGKTTDGGNNWALDTAIASISFVELNDVYFLDANNGFAVGDNGTLLRHLGNPSNPNNFCLASYWVDTINSGNGNVYIINNSTPSSSGAIFTNNYMWDFGDGSSSAQKYPVHTYTQPGAYGVCLTIITTDANSNICTDTYCDTVGLDSLGNLLYKNAMVGFTLNVIDSTQIGQVGQKELALGADAVYPNPASDELKLALPAAWEGNEIQLVEISGKLVKTTNYRRNEAVRVGDLPRGMYLLRAKDAEQNWHTKKVMLY